MNLFSESKESKPTSTEAKVEQNKFGPVKIEDVDKGNKPLISLLRDDIVFSIILSNEDILKPIVSDILKEEVKNVIFTDSQHDLTGLIQDNKVEFRVDFIAETDTSTVNFELQLYRDKYIHKRSRLYSSILDLKFAKNTGSKKYNINDNYIVFITNFDAVPNSVQAVVHCQTMTDTYEVIDDGRHIFYINFMRYLEIFDMPYIQSLCRMLAEEKEDNDFDQMIYNYLKEFKSSKRMADIMNLEINRDEYIKQGREEGREEERDRAIRSTYIAMLDNGCSMDFINKILLNTYGSQSVIDEALEGLE